MNRSRWIFVFAILVFVGAAFGAIAQQGEERVFNRGQLRAAIATQENYTPGLMMARGIVGTGVTATSTGRGVIEVYASSADHGDVPRNLDGVPVIVRVVGDIVALQGRGNGNGGGGGGGDKPKDPPVDPTARFDRPVPIGVSTGHTAITAGTIGARVIPASGGSSTYYALSNNHVYANENLASTGDDVIQPGTFDGGSASTDTIGTLAAWVPIIFSTSANNVVDAAIATVTTSTVGNSTPADGYGTPKASIIDPAVNQRVMKYGRTTGQTKGRVQAINAAVNVGYDSGVARFVGQIVIGGGGFSAGGDSGSLVVIEKGSDARRPVGLLFAGGGGVTIANPIGGVLAAFNVSIDGQ